MLSVLYNNYTNDDRNCFFFFSYGNDKYDFVNDRRND